MVQLTQRCSTPEAPSYAETVLRTTWEELTRGKYVSKVQRAQYRLTPKGWLAALELSGADQSVAYQQRLGTVLAAMKAHVKGRQESKVVDLPTLAAESNEPEGFIFNIVEGRASSPVSTGRRGAKWFDGERGRLVEIPVDFNMEPVDIVAALTIPHLEKIQALEDQLERVEEERGQFHCPHCDAEIIAISGKDFPEHHAYVTYETFACGRLTADGQEGSALSLRSELAAAGRVRFRREEARRFIRLRFESEVRPWRAVFEQESDKLAEPKRRRKKTPGVRLLPG